MSKVIKCDACGKLINRSWSLNNGEQLVKVADKEVIVTFKLKPKSGDTDLCEECMLGGVALWIENWKKSAPE